MKLLLVLSVTVALCAASTIRTRPSVNDIDESIPSIPGDNSHYVEGKSRYIWMPGSDGAPQLVDLMEPVEENIFRNRNGANNEYWLYTRQNPTSYQLLIDGNANSVQFSNYNGNRPTKVIVHGWTNSGSAVVNTVLRDAFLADSDCNVIVVDWQEMAASGYVTAVLGVPGVGQALGNFLDWLISTAGGNWNNVHLAGFSLGAHVVGSAGRTVGGRAARITGLDPAGPLWRINSNALNANDAIYTEAIHTDGGLLGINDAIAGANFYPNGGRNPQPGCGDSSCSHARAHDLFASSIRTNHLVGRLCENLSQANSNQCTGATFNLGNSILSKQGSGIYALTTGSTFPF